MTGGGESRLATAVAHHRAGRLDEAAALYQDIIDDQPPDSSTGADALNLRGVLAHQQGDSRTAVRLIEMAIGRRPGVADFHNNLGEAWRGGGDMDAAVREYRRALEIEPGHAHAHNNLGLVALAAARADDARQHFEQAIALNPAVAMYHNNLGRALSAAGDDEAAVAAFRDALSHDPDMDHAYGNLAHACQRLGAPERALDLLEEMAVAAPDNWALQARIGLIRQTQHDIEGAIAAYERALAIDPKLNQVRNNLAAALVRQGALEDALEHCRIALADGHDSTALQNNMAMALHRAGRLKEAQAAYEKALADDPKNCDIINNYGNLRIEQGAIADGLDLYQRALDIDPDDLAAFASLLARAGVAADWKRQAEKLPHLRSRLDRIAAKPSDAFTLIPLTFSLPYFCSDNDLIGDVARLVGGYHARNAQPIARPPTDLAADRRLKVAYMSPDFGDHPIGHVTLPIYAAHDRDQFEVTCYSALDRSSAGGRYLEGIRAGVDHFVDIAPLSFGETAHRIAADGIDILVDLTGYMRRSRPQTLAMRPAPIQVYWQGHTGTLGAPYIDYVLGDPVVMPAAEDDHYTEAVVRLPDTFSSADRAPIADAPMARADHGLPEDAVVFCVFNNPLKIEQEVFTAWMQILDSVPNSRLWLSWSREPSVRDTLKASAERSGVAPARLIFATRLADKAQHLARHQLADLFLDTFKFNASTTALDSLWAGLPTLTRRGNNAYSRLCASYCHAVGMPELICESTGDYVERAIVLGRDAEQRGILREKLAVNRLTQPLFDSERFVRHLETAYRMMWRRHVSGAAPQSFDVPARQPNG